MKNKEYIIKAGVGNALAVIILAKYNSNNYEQPDMLDMNSIFIYSAIKRMYNKALVIADLISVNSIMVPDDAERILAMIWSEKRPP